MSQTQPRASWLQEALAGLATVSGVGYLATAYTISRWLTRGAPGRMPETPSDRGLSWEALECHSGDGYRLAGWAVSPPGPRGTVVLFHGLRCNRVQTLDRMAFLTEAGYRCVAFDHRAHGESQGRRSSFGYYEGRDVAAVLDLVRRRWPGGPLASLGMSMGAAALCYAGRHLAGCGAVVLESLYHDLAGAFRNRIGRGYPSWFRRFVPGVIWVTEKRLGLRLAQLVPADRLATLGHTPILVLTGTDDAHAPPEDAARLHARCRGPRELYLVHGAGHRDVCEKGGAAYRERVLDFLERRLAS
jgi:pimeloyl-ACP methyl ester carboxylesterase